MTVDRVRISNKSKGFPLSACISAVGIVLILSSITWLGYRNLPRLGSVLDSFIVSTSSSSSEREGPYSVVEVIDGDTIKIRMNSQLQTIRLIGVDTPELHHPTKPVQCFAAEAKGRTFELLLSQQITLELDPSQDNTDRYGRLLRYVYLGNGEMLNQKLIAGGYAFEYTYDAPYKYQQQFKSAELEAKSARVGLWGTVCDVTSTEGATPASRLQDVNSCKYDCYAPDRDCADFSSQKESQEFFTCCGFTVDKDPMNLDGTSVGDGITCESRP